MISIKKVAGAALTAAFLCSFLAAPALSASVAVVVNGATVSFDQPPIERAGRVFVPLRGVFERLGATVVYANGDINATGNGRTVHLHIGSTSAIVNGQTTYMDQAPFLVGARTLIPLRFVAQALGAAVNWNASNNTVYINGSGSAPVTTVTPTTNPANFIRNLSPANGSHVGSSFTLSGRTRAGSTVMVHLVSTAAALGGILQVTTATSDATATANSNGVFAIPVNIQVVSGGSLRVTITSTTPGGVAVTRNIAYST